jgi:hypothetical protein
MPSATLEERLAALESEVAQIKELVRSECAGRKEPWWERRLGAFQNDPLYDEAMRRGGEYRRSQPIAADEGGPVRHPIG